MKAFVPCTWDFLTFGSFFFLLLFRPCPCACPCCGAGIFPLLFFLLLSPDNRRWCSNSSSLNDDSSWDSLLPNDTLSPLDWDSDVTAADIPMDVLCRPLQQ
eukprot:CAMPEP_0116830456 /NCGR_PEP_ID=MMETSP0418-20121206/4771_1 /TAXON_ID=1158023 /ORGANISM="Astrosyne radiata, Strain 13vi08-1A" /LENGTH=100 /DNA_ID=CAMNT_0004459557 /DNA_START=1827 /DNA_END=2130 /DNA_ORIENTATION=+